MSRKAPADLTAAVWRSDESMPGVAARPRSRVPYPVVCALLGAVLGWLPMLVHGPIPEKFNVFYLNGSLIVWAWYSARMLIGLWVGLIRWPARWWLRGPLCGALTLLPLGFISLGT